MSNPSAVHYHPYDLTIVPHNKINRQFYYTMSVDGVTHVNGDESTHMTLDEFERGCALLVVAVIPCAPKHLSEHTTRKLEEI